MSDAMSRNCFEELLSVLHLSDNMKLNTSDKLAKVRSFDNLIVCHFTEFQSNSENLSVDESMLPYYSRNNNKQQIQNKPVRLGFKMWVLAAPIG